MSPARRSFSENIRVNSDGILEVEEVDCESLAQRFGTPLFVISEAQIRENVAQFQKAFQSRYPKSLVLFATKANNNLAVRRLFTMSGAGGDCFGFGELLVTLLAGTNPDHIVLNGFVKRDDEIRLAVKAGVTIHLDLPDELDRVASIAAEADTVAKVGIRTRLMLHALDDVVSDYPAAGSDPQGESVGRNMRERDKFGISPADAMEVCKRAINEPSLQLRGLHHHLGRELADTGIFETTVREQVSFAAELRDACGWVPEYFDFGGGMAFGRPEGHGPLAHDRGSPTSDEYADAITTSFRDSLRAHGLGEPLLMVEPGRALASSIGVLLARVLARKPVPETGQTWIGVDASQNHMLNNLTGGFYYHPVPVRDLPDAPVEKVNIADPQCWYGNLAMDAELPSLATGALVAFLDVGAYCESKALNYNLAPRPATILISGREIDVVTRRETLADVVRRVRVPNRLLAGLDVSPALAMPAWPFPADVIPS